MKRRSLATEYAGTAVSTDEVGSVEFGELIETPDRLDSNRLPRAEAFQ